MVGVRTSPGGVLDFSGIGVLTCTVGVRVGVDVGGLTTVLVGLIAVGVDVRVGASGATLVALGTTGCVVGTSGLDVGTTGCGVATTGFVVGAIGLVKMGAVDLVEVGAPGLGACEPGVNVETGVGVFVGDAIGGCRDNARTFAWLALEKLIACSRTGLITSPATSRKFANVDVCLASAASIPGDMACAR